MNIQDPHRNEPQPEPSGSKVNKKPYHSPRLEAFGHIRDFTMNSSGQGPDNPGNPSTKHTI